MKKLYSAVFLIVLAAVPFSFATEEIRWFSLKEGAVLAKTVQKPMIVDFFFGKGCHRCEVLQKDVYDDPEIAKKIQRDFIPIRIDLRHPLTHDEKKLGDLHDYKNDCLLLFLDPNGNVLKDEKGVGLCFVDAVDRELFFKYLDRIQAESGTRQLEK